MIKSGELFSASGGGAVDVLEMDYSDGSVALDIPAGYGWFWPEDIKELRKFLKKLQRQLEQAEAPKPVPLSQRDDPW